MKKIILVLLGFVCFCLQASADVYVKGKIVKVEQGQGNTYITCKGNSGKCVEVSSSSSSSEDGIEYSVIAFTDQGELSFDGKELVFEQLPNSNDGEEMNMITIINN